MASKTGKRQWEDRVDDSRWEGFDVPIMSPPTRPENEQPVPKTPAQEKRAAAYRKRKAAQDALKAARVMAEEIKRARELRDWTQPELAARAGVSERTLRNVETQCFDRSPHISTFQKLADALVADGNFEWVLPRREWIFGMPMPIAPGTFRATGRLVR